MGELQDPSKQALNSPRHSIYGKYAYIGVLWGVNVGMAYMECLGVVNPKRELHSLKLTWKSLLIIIWQNPLAICTVYRITRAQWMMMVGLQASKKIKNV